MVKNGGFPPIKLCKDKTNEKISDETPKKERFFSNAPKNNINIRQILVSKKTHEPVIIIDDTKNNDDLEVIDSL
jgi:hypothetical protein